MLTFLFTNCRQPSAGSCLTERALTQALISFLGDGTNLLLTISQEGSPDIFKMTVDGRSVTRITDGPDRQRR